MLDHSPSILAFEVDVIAQFARRVQTRYEQLAVIKRRYNYCDLARQSEPNWQHDLGTFGSRSECLIWIFSSGRALGPEHMEEYLELGFSGKVAIVTGATANIGRRIALELASEGVKLIAVARHEPDPMDRAQRRVARQLVGARSRAQALHGCRRPGQQDGSANLGHDDEGGELPDGVIRRPDTRAIEAPSREK